MNFLKIAIVIILISLISLPNLFAEYYEISIPIDKNNDGVVENNKVYKIYKRNYHKNVFYLKSHEIEFYDSRTFEFENNEINNLLKDLDIISIRRPFKSKIEFALNLNPQINDVDKILEIRYSNDIDSWLLCKILSQSNSIEYVCPKYYQFLTEHVPNDPQVLEQYVHDRISSFDAWELSKGNNLIKIAIIDSGIESQNEDLDDKLLKNENEIPDDGIDNDANGFIDDYHGWDFVGDISPEDVSSENLAPNNQPFPNHPSNVHGTHVAGLAAAETNNANGVASIGYNTKIIPIKVTWDDHSQTSSVPVINGYEAIMYAHNLGADIINCSWTGGEGTPANHDVIKHVTQNNTLVVAAAGNNGWSILNFPVFPCSFEEVLCVGSSNINDKPSAFSNYGFRVDVFAPGENVLSTQGLGYGRRSGTSMAAPVVSGLAALIMDRYNGITPAAIKSRIKSTSDKIFDSQVYSPMDFQGRINAFSALSESIYGIEITDVKFEPESIIINEGEIKTVKVSIYNPYQDIYDLVVKISQMEDYKFIDIDPSEINISRIKSNETIDLEFELLINENNAWKSGFTKILIEFTSPEVSNSYIIEPFINARSFAEFFPLDSNFHLRNINSPVIAANSEFALIGGINHIKPNFSKIYNTKNYIELELENERVYDIINFPDNQEFFLLTENMVFNQHSIYLYTNTGSLISIFEYENKIDEIFLLEDKIIAYSKDTNQINLFLSDRQSDFSHWDYITYDLNHLGNSEINDNLISVFDNRIHFMFASIKSSNSYHTILTFDGKQFSEMEFDKNYAWEFQYFDVCGKDTAFVIAKRQDSKYFGGLFDLANKSIEYSLNPINDFLRPAQYMQIENTYMQVYLAEGGELCATRDFGNTWLHIKNNRPFFPKYIYPNSDDSYIDIYYASSNETGIISYLNFPKSIEPMINIQPSTLIDFGNVPLLEERHEQITIENKSNLDAIILSSEKTLSKDTNPSEFVIEQSDYRIRKGESIDIDIKFQALSEGKKSGSSEMYIFEFPLPIFFSFEANVIVTSVEENKNSTNIDIYPNPADNHITIISEEVLNRIEVFDILGNKVDERVGEYSGNFILNISEFAKGHYIIVLHTNSDKYYHKLIKH